MTDPRGARTTMTDTTKKLAELKAKAEAAREAKAAYIAFADAGGDLTSAEFDDLIETSVEADRELEMAVDPSTVSRMVDLIEAWVRYDDLRTEPDMTHTGAIGRAEAHDRARSLYDTLFAEGSEG